MERIVRENYYLDIAETVLERSTCLRQAVRRDHCPQRRDRGDRLQRRAARAEKLLRPRLLRARADARAARRAV